MVNPADHLLPWRHDGALIQDRDWNLVARITDTHNPTLMAADAALIVRAVNAHDALVALLRRWADQPYDTAALLTETRAAIIAARGDA